VGLRDYDPDATAVSVLGFRRSGFR
jgi:hypothetical protein